MADDTSTGAEVIDALSSFNNISFISTHSETGTGVDNGTPPTASPPSVGVYANKALGLTPLAIATGVYQLLALIIGLIFGAWAIKSYNATLVANDLQHESLIVANNASQAANDLASQSNQIALAANEQALLSNQIAFLQICYGSNYSFDSSATDTCQGVLAAFPLVSLARALSVSVQVLASTTTVPSTTAGTEVSVAQTSTPISTITVQPHTTTIPLLAPINGGVSQAASFSNATNNGNTTVPYQDATTSGSFPALIGITDTLKPTTQAQGQPTPISSSPSIAPSYLPTYGSTTTTFAPTLYPTPTPSSLVFGTGDITSSSGLPLDIIIGIIVGTVLGTTCIAILTLYLYKSRERMVHNHPHKPGRTRYAGE